MHVETNLKTETPAPFADAVAASADADAARVEVLREETHILEVPMSDEEQRAKGVELAEVLAGIAKLDGDIEAEKARHKSAQSKLVDEREEQLAHAKHLGALITSKTIDHDVPCRVEKVFATGVIRTVRIDTGAVVEERPMDTDERQADMFAPTTDAPESFSDLHEDESEPPQLATVHGEVVSADEGVDVPEGVCFSLMLANFDTLIYVVRGPEANDSVAPGDHVEMVGHYSGEEGAEIAMFTADTLRVLDPETEIDATKMATVGDAVESKKKNGKGRRK